MRHTYCCSTLHRLSFYLYFSLWYSQSTAAVLRFYTHQDVSHHVLFYKLPLSSFPMWQIYMNFDVLLTVHLSIFISVFNQLDAQNLFYSKFYFMPLHVSSTCAHHQEVKIALHSLWYHHSCRTRRPPTGVWWYQRLCNAILTSWWWAHLLETCRGMK